MKASASGLLSLILLAISASAAPMPPARDIPGPKVVPWPTQLRQDFRDCARGIDECPQNVQDLAEDIRHCVGDICGRIIRGATHRPQHTVAVERQMDQLPPRPTLPPRVQSRDWGQSTLSSARTIPGSSRTSSTLPSFKSRYGDDEINELYDMPRRPGDGR